MIHKQHYCGQDDGLVEAVNLFTNFGRDDSDIARLLHIDVDDVRTMQKTGKRPQRQLTLHWRDEVQG